ncbi:MAG: GAF domain-containing protein [Candidatus Eremiobacteraeota bacterium]|nr:GAF domain-containing protein [Candidatus Eremiobacteraeota bacterium]
MGASPSLRDVSVISHGADLADVRSALDDAGVTISGRAEGTGPTVHLVPYGEALAVIIDPDAPPIEWLSYPLDPGWLLAAIRTAADLLRANRAVSESRALLQICRAMSSERDVRALHRLVVRKARELTNADAGSLYLVEEVEGEKALRFAVAQTGPHDEEKYTGGYLTLSEHSIAGSVAINGNPVRISDAYEDLPGERTRFDASFDQATGYRTKSVLCVPIKNHRDEVVGVIQLINRKPSFDVALSLDVLTEQLVMPFDDHDEEILTALAAQAGVALENSRLMNAS